MRLFLALLSLVLSCEAMGMSPQEVQERVDARPIEGLPDWSSVMPMLGNLGRRLCVAAPCIGIDGCGRALSHLGVHHLKVGRFAGAGPGARLARAGPD